METEMTQRLTSLLAVAAALAMTAGCRSRPTLPPEPPSSSTADGTVGGINDGNVPGAVVPGSRADFLQSVAADRVYFDLDSYSLDGEDRATLDAQAAWLNANPNVGVTIEGHADERGTREYNLALGDRRANAARAYLESRGVSPGRMQVISWGKERPAVAESNESAYAQNRRSVTVVPE
jgi:peptidoglycan-associated lipoprotein